jgi:hypothetical protein
MRADRIKQNIAQDVIDATSEPVPASHPRDVPKISKHRRRESQSNLSDASNEVDEWGRQKPGKKKKFRNSMINKNSDGSLTSLLSRSPIFRRDRSPSFRRDRSPSIRTVSSQIPNFSIKEIPTLQPVKIEIKAPEQFELE